VTGLACGRAYRTTEALRHTGFGHTMCGATIPPSATLRMVRYARLTTFCLKGRLPRL
jgi:hypothetical protein